jgi:hypothetical protein
VSPKGWCRPGDSNTRPTHCELVRVWHAADFWTFVAIDADSKLVPSYLVGKRTRANAEAFMQDLSERLTNRVQLSTDSLPAYANAVEQAFGGDADYGQIVKFYDAEPIGPGCYSPPRVTAAERTVISGRCGTFPQA